jgi:hypothetical protein
VFDVCRCNAPCLQVGNAIGKGNRHYFVAFLWVELYAMLVGACTALAALAALAATWLCPWPGALRGSTGRRPLVAPDSLWPSLHRPLLRRVMLGLGPRTRAGQAKQRVPRAQRREPAPTTSAAPPPQVSAIVAFVVLRQRFAKESFDSDVIYLLIFEALDVFVCISVAALAIAQASQVARNVTTNELANWHR